LRLAARVFEGRPRVRLDEPAGFDPLEAVPLE
jgi:hypothetical protein